MAMKLFSFEPLPNFIRKLNSLTNILQVYDSDRTPKNRFCYDTCSTIIQSIAIALY